MDSNNPWTENKPVENPGQSKSSSNLSTPALDRLANAADAYVNQEKWSRRWTNILKIAVVLYITVSVVMLVGFFNGAKKPASSEGHAALVSIQGSIMPNSRTSANTINPLLREAFESRNAQAVVIHINSPGGSPVQSALINDEITRLKALHNKPVYVVAEDLCASGCYYIAAAADQIFANKGSIIGSIGVRFDSFGFTELMDNLGVENRSMTAGEFKSIVNPFGEEDPAAKQFFKERVLERTHQQFIEVVQRGRGDRLSDDPLLFSGLVWLGDEAVELGLIDGLGDLGFVVRDVIGVEQVRRYEADKGLMEHILGDLVSETALHISNHFIGLR
ncbi:S49 family peptidase [Thiomicrospira sp. ALE5]|uniref:S49 family peptidase n=1 Tax=Thiomicrospira sp. ALE5 TaxID=748650 RepID=UPI0008E3403D|nr:S49 family peptidase [Thiomicrospira sp. ALE5]SFR50131.1 protease-4 [Thiomicrospira sp. ALE5]